MSGDRLAAARRVADAVLYEGYVLYPYRASALKNRSRWQFGVLMPPAYATVDPSEPSAAQTECLLERRGAATLHVVVRFLQAQRRTTGSDPVDEEFWDEGVEREVVLTAAVEDLLGAGTEHVVDLPGCAGRDPQDGALRRRWPLRIGVTLRAERCAGPYGAVRVLVRVANRTDVAEPPVSRADALRHALLAAHAIVRADGGAFLSLTDPPEWAQADAAACVQFGWWPVLAGDGGGNEVVLAAPIILADHPEIAGESAGELYDGTEIDEILTLRTMALTDAEKREVRETDPRAAAVLDRVDTLPGPVLERLHGAVRMLRPPAQPEPGAPWWDPGADTTVSPGTDAVVVSGHPVARGSRVLLRPGRHRADAHDVFLAGRTATVEAVLHDVDGEVHVAVTLDDDPGADLLREQGRFLYFAPDEVEPLEPTP